MGPRPGVGASGFGPNGWSFMPTICQPLGNSDQNENDIRLNLFNLTNNYYYDALIPSDGGRAVPGTGATAVLSVTYRF